ETDERSDIYSLGATMYEAVTGSRPYPIRNLFDAVKFHTSGKLIPPKVHNPNIPNRLNILIRQMLNTDPDNRPASAAEVRTRLARFLPNYMEKSESQMVQRIKDGMKLVVPESSGGNAFASIREETLKEASRPISQCIVVSYQGHIESIHPPLIVGELLTIGRSNSANVVLGQQERYVSKTHCEIEVLKDRVVVRDLNSTNGTFLGDDRLASSISYDWELDVDINLGGYKLSLRQLNEGADVKSEETPEEEKEEEEEDTVIQGLYSLKCAEAEPHFVALHKHAIIIGRLPKCHMILPSGRVSKNHAAIELNGKDVFVTDLNSTNGSTLDGQRLPPGEKVLWDQSISLYIADFEITLVKGD
ncbi:MAG: pSer/pThr/pTyr-binding forkhead associated (FHA) protein, partial [Candidatus Promineifilaceae bacterium]